MRLVVSCLLCMLVYVKAIQTNNESTENTHSFESIVSMNDGRIVNGWETSINFFPHQVSLQLGTRHICGAAVLNSTTIITAAHCVIEFNQPHQYSIRAGSSKYTSGGMYIRVQRIIPHNMFNRPSRLNNDISLLLLSEPLVFGVNIQPIEIVQNNEGIHPQAMLYVSGWGALSPQSKRPEENLRYTNIVQINQQYCRNVYFGAGVVTATMFCAGSKFGGRDSCQGDSGGPLVTIVNGRMKLYGIVSWGLGCGDSNYPGVYTRVSAYNEWVSQSMHRFNS